MCGIFGYIGKQQANLSSFLLEGLRKLEYRGYDSAGIAVCVSPDPLVFKAVGGVDQLAKKIGNKDISGSIGLAHTRWATHGAVNEANAHPHLDCKKEIIVVHNGIVENYEKLKKMLVEKGHRFYSDTDTEVIAHLVEDELNGKSYTARHFAYAVYRVFKKLSGLNAIIVGSTKACCLVAFRKGSPLSIGFASNSIIVSSDLPTLNSYTKSIILLDEGEGALLFMDKKPVFFSSSGKIVLKKARQIEFTTYSAKKGDFSHYMLKEIYEEPDVLARIAKYPQDPLLAVSEMIKNAYGTYFTACGTAAHAGLAATYLFSHIAKRHVNFALGSEFYFLEDFLVPRSLLIVASQSGETMDTLEAVRAAKRHKSKVVALVNVPGSTLTRLADLTLFLMAGPELAVASTKAYVAKLALFVLLSFACADKLILGLRLIDKTAKAVANLFDEGIEKKIKRVAKKIYKNEHIFIIGRSINYPTALEAALKIKEISYIHAEGFAGGELKHGVIALIEKGTPCLVFVADDESRDNVLANAMELKSRGGYMIGIGTKSDGIFDEFIHLPNVGFASPIVNIIPAQLLAYYLATLKGLNPDRPRNLAKSVVVK